MSNDQIDELYGKGSLGKINQYHKDASAVSTDSYDAKSYHDASVRRSEFLGKREKAKADIAKAKKGSTREKGWRNYLQSKDDSERQRNWSQRHRNKLSPAEKRIHNTYVKARGVQEDAPTVNAGSGNIAGIGVGPKGEPGVSPKHQAKNKSPVLFPKLMKRSEPQNIISTRRSGQFAGAAVFEVNSKIFHNLTMQKRKGKHWRTYLEEDDCYAEIREWAAKNPKSKIVVRNESTGEMRYVRY